MRDRNIRGFDKYSYAKIFVFGILCIFQFFTTAFALENLSRPLTEILNQPNSSEELKIVLTPDKITIQGPTFCYGISRSTGSIYNVEALRQDTQVVTLKKPVKVTADNVDLFGLTDGTTHVIESGTGKIDLITEGRLKSGDSCVICNTIYNDGVLVSEIRLTPAKDIELKQGIRVDVECEGIFSHYIHKRRDTDGMDCVGKMLPPAETTLGINTPTSCLEVYSGKAALAMFTDMGSFYRSPDTMDTAFVHVSETSNDICHATLCQHIISVGEGGIPYVLKGGETFTFRTGLAIAPNRLPHPRQHDLRMFIWVGDDKYPYPSDREIYQAARLGYTMFQMHRLGPPGKPRPPETELERVIQTVHNAGMLFIWTANADLQYRHDPVVSGMIDKGEWARWEGFNYGGRYVASMDAFCDLQATCLASPNGLADYRLECINTMLDRYPVDGMYIDDNLPYANCTLWKEHNHPQRVYDCLIELHEVNWMRRQAMLAKCPHAVLIDHCSHAYILPSIASFDSHLFGEGYTFDSVETFRDSFGSFNNMYAQGCLWAGDSETNRCGTQIAYIFDLLSRGGQYSYLDWRLWPNKFPYASGIKPYEHIFVQTYNIIQYNFGMYESEFMNGLATTAPGTYAALYHNRVWKDNLVVVANMNAVQTECSLASPGIPQQLLDTGNTAVYFDVNRRHLIEGVQQNSFPFMPLAPYQLAIWYMRNVRDNTPFHLWGGKRLAERWDEKEKTLSVVLEGPAGLEDWVLLGTGGREISHVSMDNNTADFYRDPEGHLAFGKIIYTSSPATLMAYCEPKTYPGKLPLKTIMPDAIISEFYEQKQDRSS